MKRADMWVHAVGGAAVLALALGGTAACGGSATTGDATPGPSASTGTGTTPATTAATTTPAAATGGPSADASPVLADGRSAVYLTGLDTARNAVTFDLIEFLTGDAARAEWKKEHPENPEGPDNDYMIVNKNKKLRTLPVSADARCVVLTTLGGTETKSIGFAALPTFLKQQSKEATPTPPAIAVLPFWLTVRHGTVVRIEEQFLP